MIGVEGVRGKEDLVDVELGEGEGGRGECAGEPRVGNGRDDVSSLPLDTTRVFEGTFFVSTVRRRAFIAAVGGSEGSGGGEEDSEESES